MKSRKKSFILVGILFVGVTGLILFLWNQKKNVTYPLQMVSDENHRILVQAHGLRPDSFYLASVKREEENIQIFGSSYDKNGKWVISDGKDKTCGQVSRIVMSDKNGNLDFTIVGDDINTKSITLSNLPKTYHIYHSSEGDIRLVVKKEDILNSHCSKATIKQWLDVLSGFRKDMIALTGKEMSSIAYVATETFGHYGLSGNPIYINQDYVCEDLSKINLNGVTLEQTILWRYLHEMCHVFDGATEEQMESYVFDGELWAQLETLYLLKKNGYSFDDGKEPFWYFQDSIPLEQGIYSDEGLLNKLAHIFEKYDSNMSSLKAVIMSDRFEGEHSRSEKIQIFFDILSEEMKVSLREEFSDKEWKVAVQN